MKSLPRIELIWAQSIMWWMSNVLVLGGSFAYTMVRRAEMQAKIAAKESSKDK